MSSISQIPRFTTLDFIGSTRDPVFGPFRASDRLLPHSSVVIKAHQIPAELATDPQALLFAAESFLSLSHPALPTTIDLLFDSQKKVVHTVTEYAEGQSFIEGMRKLNSGQFITVVVQLCSAMHYLHARGRAHLDLHPGNLLLKPSTTEPTGVQVLFLDLPFLTLELLQLNPDLIHFNKAFSSPELLSGTTFDHRSDLYSLGVLLRAVLTPNNSPKDHNYIPSPHTDNTGWEQDAQVPDYLLSLIRKLERQAPDRRPSSSYFVFEELKSALPDIDLNLDDPAEMTSRIRSQPLLRTASLDAGLLVIESCGIFSGQTRSFSLTLRGLPGSGKTRTLRALRLYSRLIGGETALILRDAKGDIELVSENVPRNIAEPAFSRAPFSVLPLFIAQETSDQESLKLVADFLASQHRPFMIVLTDCADFTTYNCTPNITTDPIDRSNVSIHVGRLRDDEAMRLVRDSFIPNSFAPEFVEEVSEQCLCLPGLICQHLEHLLEIRAIARQGAHWIHQTSTQERLVDLQRANLIPHLQSLPESHRNFLTLVSLTPFPITIPQASRALSAPQDQAFKISSELCDQGVLLSTGNGYKISNLALARLIKETLNSADLAIFAKTALASLGPNLPFTDPQTQQLIAFLAIHAGENSLAAAAAEESARHHRRLNDLSSALGFYRIAISRIDNTEQPHRTHLLLEATHVAILLGNQRELVDLVPTIEESMNGLSIQYLTPLSAMLAKLYLDIGKFDLSLQVALRTLSLSSITQDPTAYGSALSTIAWYLFRCGNLADAQSKAQAAADSLDHNISLPDVRRAYSVLSGSSYLQGNFATAVKWESRILLSAVRESNAYRFANSCVNLGIVYMESGQLKRAQKSFNAALRASQSSPSMPSIVNANSNLMILHQYRGHLVESARCFQLTQELLEQGGDPHIRHQSMLSHADSLLLAGMVGAAHDLVLRAIDWARNSGDTFTAQTGELQRCSILSHSGATERSLEGLKQLISAFQESGFRIYGTFAQIQLAEDTAKTAATREAAHALEIAFDSLPVESVACLLKYQIAEARLSAIEGDYTICIRRCIVASNRARKGGFWRFLFEAWLCLAQAYLAVGKVEEAGTVLKKLAGLHKRIKLRLFEPWLFQAMADYAAAIGDARESKKHLLNARTSLMELSYNISDPDLRQQYLNRPDSRSLLARSEDLEDLAYEGFPDPPESPQATRALESIARINEQLHRRDSLKSTLSLIIEEAIRLSSAERGIVFLFDASGREELKVSRNIGRRSLADARKYTRTALQRIRHGEIVFAADTVTDPQFSASESITQLRIRSVACVPLRSRGSIIGALYLDSRRPRLAASHDLLKSLEIFAQQASAALERAIRYFNLAEENQRLREAARIGVPTLIGQGTYFAGLKKLIVAAGSTDLPVLILGESGTGKELVARAIHYSGKRSTEPFLSVDCGTLPEKLVESELFGYRRGAFSGADADKEGLFVAARGGTLFLDEIGNTTPSLQVKLLRAIQEREVRPVGATESIPFQARIVAATNRDLRRDARDGRFRQDLLFRLNGMTIELPALRDRKGEIPLLIDHFLRKTRERYGHRIQGVSDEALLALARFDWPGNIRELENSIERAVALAQGDTIKLKDLPDSVRSAAVVSWSEKRGEHRLIEEALLRFAGDKSRAADYIGWNRQKLYRKMEQYNIPIDFGRRNTA